MKNFLQEGNVVVVAAPTGGVSSGDFVVSGKMYGVCQVDAAAAADVPLARTGVFTLPKATGAAWTQGDQLYWDSTNKVFTKTATGNAQVGIAFAAAASGDATGQVDIRPGHTLAVAS